MGIVRILLEEGYNFDEACRLVEIKSKQFKRSGRFFELWVTGTGRKILVRNGTQIYAL